MTDDLLSDWEDVVADQDNKVRLTITSTLESKTP